MKKKWKRKKYYYNGKLKLEGEYLNGEKWNGIRYSINDNVEYEIKEGKGNIKEYNYTGELRFEGEYINGKRNGKEYNYYGN